MGAILSLFAKGATACMTPVPTLLSMIPAWVWRLALYAALLAALCGWCWLNGANHVQAQWAAERQAVAVRIVRVQASQAAATAQIQTRIVYQTKIIHDQAQAIQKDIPHEITVHDCALSGGFRVLHDAAVTGAVPAAGASAVAATVSASQAASTIAANYAGCRDNAARLAGWQDWYRRMQQIQAAH